MLLGDPCVQLLWDRLQLFAKACLDTNELRMIDIHLHLSQNMEHVIVTLRRHAHTSQFRFGYHEACFRIMH